MFWATTIEGGYQVEIDGPISPFVQSTTRYGRQFAAFLPALFLCERWNMQASVRPPHLGKTLTYSLDHTSELRTHFKRSPLFDSRLEADFAAEFEAKFGGERGKWILTREDQVLLVEDTVMIPDFTLTHRDTGKQALIEIVGFWHPDYLRRKLEIAPYWHPDGKHILFASNVDDPQGRNFDIYMIDIVSRAIERVTNYPGFDSFPMVSHDGKKLVFASNRNGKVRGETNIFIADWVW
jgi:predicted nuclease of restriction endonuclease-like RecB superfamily